jgi:choline-glycine betaine transporter
VEKNKITIIDMLKEHTSCQLCIVRNPLNRIEKNNFNIIFFFVIHIIIELMVFTIILPCKNIIKLLNKIDVNSKNVSISYVLLFCVVVIVYIILIYSNPGLVNNKNKSNDKKSLLVN